MTIRFSLEIIRLLGGCNCVYHFRLCGRSTRGISDCFGGLVYSSIFGKTYIIHHIQYTYHIQYTLYSTVYGNSNIVYIQQETRALHGCIESMFFASNSGIKYTPQYMASIHCTNVQNMYNENTLLVHRLHGAHGMKYTMSICQPTSIGL